MANGFNPDYWAKGQFMKNNPLYANAYDPSVFNTPQSGGFDPSYWNNVGGNQSGDLSYWNSPQGQSEPDLSIWDNPGGDQSADLSVWNNPGGDQSADLSVWDNVGGDQSADLSVWENVGGTQTPDMSVWDNVGGDQSADLSYWDKTQLPQKVDLSYWDNIGGDHGPNLDYWKNQVKAVTDLDNEWEAYSDDYDPDYFTDIGTKTANKIAQDGLIERAMQTEDDDDMPYDDTPYEYEDTFPYLDETLYEGIDDLGQTPATEEDLLLADERMEGDEEEEGMYSSPWSGLLSGLGKGLSEAGRNLLETGGYQYTL